MQPSVGFDLPLAGCVGLALASLSVTIQAYTC